jgi:hypothetical protein
MKSPKVSKASKLITARLALPLSVVILASTLNGCTSAPARINPGHLDTSVQAVQHTATISNIIQLSEKEAPNGKVFKGVLVGALIGGALSSGHSDSTQEDVAELGALIGGYSANKKHAKTIYRLTLNLDDKSVKEVYVRGGHYIVGKHAKITLDRNSGDVTSFVSIKAS